MCVCVCEFWGRIQWFCLGIGDDGIWERRAEKQELIVDYIYIYIYRKINVLGWIEFEGKISISIYNAKVFFFFFFLFLFLKNFYGRIAVINCM